MLTFGTSSCIARPTGSRMQVPDLLVSHAATSTLRSSSAPGLFPEGNMEHTMIRTPVAGAIVAVAFMIGILAGSAGTIVIRDATRPGALDMNAQMGRMAKMSMMAGGSGMMAGGSGMMNGHHGMGVDGMGPARSAGPDSMQQHHQPASAAPSR
jgi:hypothetical protein